MTDERDFIDKTASKFENRSDEEFDIQKIADDFPLYGHEKRAQALDYLDEQMGECLADGDLRKISDLHRLRERMRSDHKKLRAAKR